MSTDGGEALGVVTEGTLSAKLLNGRSEPTDPVSKGMYTRFRKVRPRATVSSARVAIIHAVLAGGLLEYRNKN